GIVEWQDVRVGKAGGEVDLAQEALGAERRGDLRAQDLDGDGAAVPEIAREVHGGHAAVPQLALERVAGGEGGAERVESGGQGRSSAPRRLRSEEHTSELQSRFDLVCRLLLEKKNIHQAPLHIE